MSVSFHRFTLQSDCPFRRGTEAVILSMLSSKTPDPFDKNNNFTKELLVMVVLIDSFVCVIV